MNDKVMRMAIECQLINTSNRTGIYADALQKFADLIRADEREACALVCDDFAKYSDWPTADNCAATIRARSNT
jgi:hypothetical protein